MTRQEIINYCEQVIQTNPKAFTPEDNAIIEDNYIYIPAVEFRRDPNTNKWIPV